MLGSISVVRVTGVGFCVDNSLFAELILFCTMSELVIALVSITAADKTDNVIIRLVFITIIFFNRINIVF